MPNTENISSNSESIPVNYISSYATTPLPFAPLNPYTIHALDIEYVAPLSDCASIVDGDDDLPKNVCFVDTVVQYDCVYASKEKVGFIKQNDPCGRYLNRQRCSGQSIVEDEWDIFSTANPPYTTTVVSGCDLRCDGGFVDPDTGGRFYQQIRTYLLDKTTNTPTSECGSGTPLTEYVQYINYTETTTQLDCSNTTITYGGSSSSSWSYCVDDGPGDVCTSTALPDGSWIGNRNGYSIDYPCVEQPWYLIDGIVINTLYDIPIVNFQNVYSNPYTTQMLKELTLSEIPDYANDWNCHGINAGSYSKLELPCELKFTAQESHYRIRFKIPESGNYRVTWVERFIPSSGVGITSLRLVYPGSYRPTVSISAPPSGGTQAEAVARMNPDGTIASIEVLNQGSGYTSAPSVTIQSAINGGVTSVGWTAFLSGGSVSSISGGTAGNYLPEVFIVAAPLMPGSGAAAVVTMDSNGGINTVQLISQGAGFTREPILSIISKVSSSQSAIIFMNLGQQVEKCEEWDKFVPVGYDENDISTYPVIPPSGYYTIPIPLNPEGFSHASNVLAFCDGSPCQLQ